MTIERAGALAIFLGMIAGITLMAFHPAHLGDAVLGPWSVNTFVHTTGLVCAPVLLFGAIAITRHLGFDRPLPLLGLAFYACGAIAIQFAALLDGFVMANIGAAAHADGADAPTLHGLMQITRYMNQACAHLHTGMASLAILCWSIAWPAHGAWRLKIVGFVVSLGLLAWQVSGALTLNIHGMGAVVLGQSIWLIGAAMYLWRSKPHA